MQAISAAALLLSLGEVGNRSASLCSGLLYHQTRFVTPSSHTLTAAAAMFAAKQLIESDRRLMERLCTHLLDGYGGELAFAQTALMRIEKISRVRISNPEAVTPSWERITKNAFEEVASKGNIQAYQSLLMRRFDEDSLMSLDEALALMLIDDVQPTGIPLNL
jgi:ATP-dependent protease ClpP protease subunit